MSELELLFETWRQVAEAPTTLPICLGGANLIALAYAVLIRRTDPDFAPDVPNGAVR